jgi:hypothetical protein
MTFNEMNWNERRLSEERGPQDQTDHLCVIGFIYPILDGR